MKRAVAIPVLVAVVGVTALVSLTLGRYPVSLSDLVHFLGLPFSGSPALSDRKIQIIKNLLFDIRLPRVVAAMLIGASLSVSGAVFQSMFINPLVSPGLLGVLAGASFGAAVGMILAESWWVVQVSAFFFGLVAVSAALAMSTLNRGERLLMLILGGIISGALFTSLLSVVKYLADPYEQLPAIVYWLMGSLTAVDRTTVFSVCGPMVGAIVILILLSGYLNIMSMGDEEARALGVNVGLLRLGFIFLATVISALTVVLGGIIGWVGLLIPHIARMLVGPDNRILLPSAALIGAAYLLIADNIARLLFSVEIPIGILTSLVGIPFFAFVLRRTKKGSH
ncbi:iron ABC transporter permease [Desulfosarcina ovata subsp. sediminis]|uniref:Iron ABC transporter permease n=1 Tax=Desulfosarcina ovata subsp. sediminis TaxID=885957 RepID=A0A5K8A1U3_9BACT|nr:iron ABC transporter permease [Desulfosarcina ovata]BBO86467.1 iron ABC transporter permease [Desulfosarcina ovata subsp. sediminis]